jgi:uncharacterized protein (DUF302 family)
MSAGQRRHVTFCAADASNHKDIPQERERLMNNTTTALGLHVHLDSTFDDAVARVTAALKAEGFGVLTEIDVKDTLKKKINVDFRPYKILGACNPPLAHRALMAAPEVGLLLPCNVTVAAAEKGVDVALVDPIAMLGFVGKAELEPIAEEARVKLARVAQALKA